VSGVTAPAGPFRDHQGGEIVCRDCGRRSLGNPCAGCLKHRLADRIDALLDELLPAGHREAGGREFRVGSLAGEPGRSLVIELGHQDRLGLWYDHAGGVGGDILDLIASIHSNGNNGQALRWARRWLQLPLPERRPRTVPTEQTAPVAVQAEIEATWHKALRLRRADCVDQYLAGRGISLQTLADTNGGRLPGSLRFHPQLWCAEARRTYPAMLAAIRDSQGALVGLHRTWFARRADGTVAKAPVQVPKRSRGQVRGTRGIELWRGSSGEPWASAPASDVLALSEGVENGLSGALAQPAWRVTAAVSVGAMLTVLVPAAIFQIVLIVDNDAPGSPSAQVLEQVRARFRCEAKEVWLLRSPRWAKDVNELLQAMPKKVVDNG
jgi:hypothetical protein